MQPMTLVIALFASAALAGRELPPRLRGPARRSPDLVPGGSLLPRSWLSSFGLPQPVTDVTKREAAPEAVEIKQS
ncbi:hypothetical protein C8034_v002943 [Colletotrichum sidae]|uniref:Uncharacterized protein n=1 Tax=Colletotrichum sidae TaxID=1347389 RepID=A0A4R8TV58_9PEZI|nr:hypothetical protein C8034_v002943 [Colletotrichum sidae]